MTTVEVGFQEAEKILEILRYETDAFAVIEPSTSTTT